MFYLAFEKNSIHDCNSLNKVCYRYLHINMYEPHKFIKEQTGSRVENSYTAKDEDFCSTKPQNMTINQS